MRFIRQIGETDCGIATAAMMADVSYGEAMRASHNDCEDGRWLSTTDMVKLLRNLGVKNVVRQPCDRKPLALLKSSERAAYVIRDVHDDIGHWVVFEDGKVYDPDMFASDLAGYAKRDWLQIYRVWSDGGRP